MQRGQENPRRKISPRFAFDIAYPLWKTDTRWPVDGKRLGSDCLSENPIQASTEVFDRLASPRFLTEAGSLSLIRRLFLRLLLLSLTDSDSHGPTTRPFLLPARSPVDF
jgi:hypothetical protein